MVLLAGALTLETFFFLTRPEKGLDSGIVGSIGDWAAGFGTVVAVFLAYRQFTRSQADLLDAEHRAEALKVTAWTVWDSEPARDTWLNRLRGGPRRHDPRLARASNRSNSAVFDWSVTIVPSSGWDTYVRFSARLGPMHPEDVKTISIDPPHPSVIYRRTGIAEKLGPPRFVVLRFNDAWGNGWVRTNGDLQRIPADSRFLPLLVHLRSPAMKWAGTLDEAMWQAFRAAVGDPPQLPEKLESILRDREQPWLGEQLREWNRVVQGLRPRRIRTYSYLYPRRLITRKISMIRAVRSVRRFFRDAAASPLTEVLYMKGD